MADWSAYVRRRLQLPALEHEREAEIVEDLARQLDDAYRDALASGADEASARARAEQHIPDWTALAREISKQPRHARSRIDRWSERLDDGSVERAGAFTSVGRFRQDLVYAWRMVRRAPAVALVVVLSLALGIGANTAIFSVIHALVFRTLPVPHAEQLVSFTDPQSSGIMTGLENGERTLLSYHEFEGLRPTDAVLAGLMAFGSENLSAAVAVPGESEGRPASVSLVSGSYFPTLGVVPATGSTFGVEVDAARLAHPVAVLSDRFWERRFQRDPGIVGRTIQIRRTTFDVIGVMPKEFTGLVVGDMPDVWVPLTMQEAVSPGRDWLTQAPGSARRTMFLHVVGRLKPGVSLAQADAVVNGLFLQGLKADAELIVDADRRRDLVDASLVVRDARRGMSPLRGEYRDPLTVLMVLVGLLLLLTCANVANLLLARSTGRQRELAMRVVLGAGRMRLVRQLLTESLMLAAFGAVVGLGVAYGGTRVLLRLAAAGAAPIPLDAPLDGAVLAFTALLALATGFFFGLVPALRATRLDLNATLRAAAPNLSGARRRRRGWPLGQVLAGVQVAISLLLLITAGLFLRSLQQLTAVPFGYDTDRLVMFRLSPAVDGYQAAAIGPLFEDVLARLNRMPGVRRATLSYNGLFYDSELGSAISLPGANPVSRTDMSTNFDLVGPGYFSALEIPVLAGRDVDAADSTGIQGCWVNETAARYFFGDENPIGRRMVAHFSFGDAEYEIRGVVADSRAHSVRDKISRRFYLPYFKSIIGPVSAVFEVRTTRDVADVIPGLRQLVRDVDPRIQVPTFRTVPELAGAGLGRDRTTAQLSTVFGGLAVILASLGLYGVLSYSVSRRVGEIGVRLALGARPRRIVGLVVRDALWVVVAGIAAGLAVAVAIARLLDSLLFGLTGRDPMTFAAAAVLLLVVASVAAAVPAWRASRVDPLTALRGD